MARSYQLNPRPKQGEAHKIRQHLVLCCTARRIAAIKTRSLLLGGSSMSAPSNREDSVDAALF
jgi:hypothetical protein